MGSGAYPIPSVMPHSGGGGMMVLGASAAAGNTPLVMASLVFLALWTLAMAAIAVRGILPKAEA